ncbi:MAG TPA: hypothetical protein PKH33_02925 [bacterium]|nr:hypothetical protein [bacterium]
MSDGKRMARVSAATHRGMAEQIFIKLRECGITGGHLAAGRSIMLEDKKGFLGVGARSAIVEDPIEIISIIAPTEMESAVLDAVVSAGRIDIPGRGSVHSEEIVLLKAHELCVEQPRGCVSGQQGGAQYIEELMGICCIVQRGQGDAVARVALDTGTCVPAITFGLGTGVRDKLGLLRIAIPADKEVVALAASVHDADAVMELMIDIGRLDEPGKGFIHLFPIRKGVVNTKITRGMPKHAASIEQIISALDQIKGGTQWRSRSGMAADGVSSRRKYLSGLSGLSLICDEGRADDLVKAAMSAGAAGATISRLKHVRPQDSPLAQISPARELCDMIVGEQQIPAILAALENAGAFDDKSHGLLFSKPVPKACTFLG